MRVNPNNEASVISATPSRTAVPQPSLGQDKMAVAATDSLNRSLEQTPESRAEKVAEAKALLQNGSYPPAVIIRKISALLAIKLNPQNNAD